LLRCAIRRCSDRPGNAARVARCRWAYSAADNRTSATSLSRFQTA
jgi:hypothetical protein